MRFYRFATNVLHREEFGFCQLCCCKVSWRKMRNTLELWESTTTGDPLINPNLEFGYYLCKKCFKKFNKMEQERERELYSWWINGMQEQWGINEDLIRGTQPADTVVDATTRSTFTEPDTWRNVPIYLTPHTVREINEGFYCITTTTPDLEGVRESLQNATERRTVVTGRERIQTGDVVCRNVETGELERWEFTPSGEQQRQRGYEIIDKKRVRCSSCNRLIDNIELGEDIKKARKKVAKLGMEIEIPIYCCNCLNEKMFLHAEKIDHDKAIKVLNENGKIMESLAGSFETRVGKITRNWRRFFEEETS